MHFWYTNGPVTCSSSTMPKDGGDQTSGPDTHHPNLSKGAVRISRGSEESDSLLPNILTTKFR